MANKRIKEKKVKKIEEPENALAKINERMELLENQIKERDAQIELLDKTQKNSVKGSQQYGVSDWVDWENGEEKGYHRKIYVNVRSLVTPRAM